MGKNSKEAKQRRKEHKREFRAAQQAVKVAVASGNNNAADREEAVVSVTAVFDTQNEVKEEKVKLEPMEVQSEQQQAEESFDPVLAAKFGAVLDRFSQKCSEVEVEDDTSGANGAAAGVSSVGAVGIVLPAPKDPLNTGFSNSAEFLADEADEAAQGKQIGRNKRFRDVAELKMAVDRPDLVAPHDENSPDPQALNRIKSLRNIVGVPRHWAQKRRYLSLKKAVIKEQFELPHFIASTGVARIRKDYILRTTQGQGKRVDVNYKQMHEAFFVHQPKPSMTGYGEVFYEGRETKNKCKGFRPGVMSIRLRKALDMQDGHPAPWLKVQQRLARLPPSYAHLKFPGLNYPIPLGAQWGPMEGQWGNPPRDQVSGQPLFPEVMGVKPENDEEDFANAPYWGGEGGDVAAIGTDMVDPGAKKQAQPEQPKPAAQQGPTTITPQAGGAAPQLLGQQVYQQQQQQRAVGADPNAFYSVLNQRDVGQGAAGLVPSSHVYDTRGGQQQSRR